jgi:phage tail protein X
MMKKVVMMGILSSLLVFITGTLTAQTPSAPNVSASGISLNIKAAQTHTVVWGDTLTKIAHRYYGEQGGYCFPLILFANRAIISNPEAIEPGMKLAIPELRLDLMNAAARAELKSYTMEVAWWYARTGKTQMKDALIRFAEGL